MKIITYEDERDKHVEMLEKVKHALVKGVGKRQRIILADLLSQLLIKAELTSLERDARRRTYQ